jgi:hypothetical protein
VVKQEMKQIMRKKEGRKGGRKDENIKNGLYS